MEIKSLGYQLNDLRRAGKYNEVIELYHVAVLEKSATELILEDPWIVFAVMFSLRKSGKPEDSLRVFYEDMKSETRKGMHEALLREVGWSLEAVLRKQKAAGSERIKQYVKHAVALIDIIDPKKDYLLYKLLFFGVADFWTSEVIPDWNGLSEFLGKAGFQTFSLETNIISRELIRNKREEEMASDRERLYTAYSKALFMAGRYQECIRICLRAFEEIRRFHHGNNVWLSRRLAVSYLKAGNRSAAIDGLKEVLKKKEDWFIQMEMAGMLWDGEKQEEGLLYAIKAALNGGYSEYKVNLFMQLGDMFEGYGKKELAKEHYLLSYLIRREKRWKHPAELLLMISEERLSGSEIERSEDIYCRLKTEWDKELSKAGQKVGTKFEKIGEGEVTLVLHEGEDGDGFITDWDGSSIYFRFWVFKGDNTLIRKGLKVRFKAKEREWKNKKVWNATQVREFV